MVQSTCYSYTSGFGSQHPRDGLQLCITPVPGDTMLSSDLYGLYACTYTHT